MAYGAVNAIIRDNECKLVTRRLETIIAIFLQPKEGRKVVNRVYLGGIAPQGRIDYRIQSVVL